jgi:photosystem II stability/assembly factor-like uncharacterized protein
LRSIDSGQNWVSLESNLPVSWENWVTALAIDPKNSATLYVGTRTTGVFKSTDGGASWTAYNQGLNTFNITVVAVHPKGAGCLYAATYDGGVYSTCQPSN